jgi:hypothetical protein
MRINLTADRIELGIAGFLGQKFRGSIPETYHCTGKTFPDHRLFAVFPTLANHLNYPAEIRQFYSD